MKQTFKYFKTVPTYPLSPARAATYSTTFREMKTPGGHIPQEKPALGERGRSEEKRKHAVFRRCSHQSPLLKKESGVMELVCLLLY